MAILVIKMKATLFSLLSLFVSLLFFGLLFRPGQPANSLPTCNPVASTQAPVETKPEDPNEKFRFVPSNFMHVDFKNRSYGLYQISSKVSIAVNLSNGEYEYSDGDGGEWFSLKDVFFTDVTGDESPEAVVFLWHVQCSVSCDGGNALLLVYETYGSSLKEIWRFESGSYAYGCGLKSLTIMKRQLTVQMFGKCPNPQMLGYNDSGKFMHYDTTLYNFRFAGGRFVKKEKEFFPTPLADVKNYKPQIQIID